MWRGRRTRGRGEGGYRLSSWRCGGATARPPPPTLPPQATLLCVRQDHRLPPPPTRVLCVRRDPRPPPTRVLCACGSPASRFGSGRRRGPSAVAGGAPHHARRRPSSPPASGRGFVRVRAKNDGSQRERLDARARVWAGLRARVVARGPGWIRGPEVEVGLKGQRPREASGARLHLDELLAKEGRAAVERRAPVGVARVGARERQVRVLQEQSADLPVGASGGNRAVSERPAERAGKWAGGCTSARPV
eukprot:5422395-Prymnesium_polylepis.1